MYVYMYIYIYIYICLQTAPRTAPQVRFVLPAARNWTELDGRHLLRVPGDVDLDRERLSNRLQRSARLWGGMTFLV